MDRSPLRLWPGESVVWTGTPVRSTMFRPNDAFLIPFSLLWAALSVLPTALGVTALGQVRRTPGILPFALFGLVFGVLGGYMLLARFVVRAFTSRRVRYVVTTQRVVVLAGRSGFQVRSGILRLLPPPVHHDAADGSGSIAFGAFPPIQRPRRRIAFSAFGAEPGSTPVLWYVANVRHAWSVIAAAQSGYPIPDSRPDGTVADSPLPSAGVAAPGRSRRSHAQLPPGRVALLVLLAVAVAAVPPAVLVAADKYGLGPAPIRATVTSCAPTAVPQSRTYTYTCAVTWRDGTGQHSAEYSSSGTGTPRVGTVLPVRVRDGVVSDGSALWAHELLAAEALGALLAVAVVVRFTRRRSAGLR